MQQGITFGMEGPTMTGTWTNPKTGHSFTVRECMFVDNELTIITTAGQHLNYNAIQDYVQDYKNPHQAVEVPTATPSHEPIPQEVLDILDLEDPYINPTPTPRRISLGNPVQNDPDQAIIDRVLRKHSVPQVRFEFEWKVPRKQLETLVDILGMEPDDIAKYYMKSLSVDSLYKDLQDQLSTYMHSLVNPNPEPAPQPKASPRPKKPTKK